MKKSITTLDKVVILCRNVQRTAEIYCQSLGLRVVMQSPQFVQLRDANNLKLYLKATKKPYQLPKGYSPILSFKVEYFDQVREKLLRLQLLQDGGVIETSKGKITSFLGPEGQHISINNFAEEQQTISQRSVVEEEDKASQEIKNLLNKIKL